MATDRRPLGFWLTLVDSLINEQFAGTLEEHGVTRRQWQLLNVLAGSPATTAELDDAVRPFLTEPGESSSDHVEELMDSGWVVLNGETYSLTERGAGAFTRLQTVVDANRAIVATNVDPADYLTTLAVLVQMARNLGWREPDGT